MRKRSKYRPKGVLVNALGYVLDGFAPMTSHGTQLLDLQLKNHEARVALHEGRAGTAQIGNIIALYNIAEALYRMGVGKEYGQYVDEGREAIISIVRRSHEIKKFTATEEETVALLRLYELHDAQMEVVTVREMDMAIKLAKKEVASGKAINLRKSV